MTPVVESSPQRWRVTSLQRSMLLAGLKHPDRPTFAEQRVISLPPATEVKHVTGLWTDLVTQHSILRSQVAFQGTDVFLYHLPSWNLEGAFREIACDDEDQLRAEYDREHSKPFTLSSDLPLWRLSFIKGRARRLLCLTFHHIVVDQRTIDLLVADIGSRLLGQTSRAYTGQFHDYLAWLEGKDFDYLKESWQKYAAPLAEPTLLPVSPTSAPGDDAAQARFSHDLEQSIADGIRAFSARHELTVNTILLGAWALVLSRLAFQETVCFGVIRGGYANCIPDARQIYGSLIKTLPFIQTVASDVTCLGYLLEVRRRWQFLYEADHCPIELLMEWTPPSDEGPLFSTIFNFTRREQRGSGPRVVHARKSLVFEPTLSITDGETIRLDLVSPQRHESFARLAWQALPAVIRQLLNTEALLGSISLGADEVTRIAAFSKGRDLPFAGDTLAALLEVSFAKHSALLALDGHVTLSFRELERATSSLAARLRESGGTNSSQPIAIVLPAGPLCIITLVALARSGRPFICLNPEAPYADNEAVLAIVKPAALIVTANTPVEYQHSEWAAIVVDEKEAIDARAGVAPCSPAGPNDLAYMVHTSGSTGLPKVIEIEQHSLANFIQSVILDYGIHAGDRRFHWSQPGPDFFLAELLPALCAGVTIIYTGHQRKFTPDEYLGIIDRHQVSYASAPGSYWRELVDRTKRDPAMQFPKSLRLLITGMEAVDADALRDWHLLGPKSIRLLNAYGPSETTIVSTVGSLEHGIAEGELFVPIGRPIANTSIYVLDRAGQLLPPGAIGEICIAGEGVMRGYAGRDQQLSLRPNPYDSRPNFSRVYHSGDFGFYNSTGELVFIGRRDNQVKLRGHRVELSTVEMHLAGAADGLAVVAITVRRRGQNVLIGLVESNDPSSGGAIRARLRGTVKDVLIPAKMIAFPDFPRLPNGKINRQALRRMAKLKLADEVAQPSLVSTETNLGLMIEIWNELFEISECSAESNFFDLGGDSLIAVRLSAQVEQRLGMPLPLNYLYAAPTVADLVSQLENEVEPQRFLRTLVPIAAGPGCHPIFAIHGLGGRILRWRTFFSHFNGERDCWGIQSAEQTGAAPAQSLAEMCAHYARAILENAGKREVIIVGHSLGGIVAHETARHLQETGGSIRCVVILDAPSPAMSPATDLRDLLPRDQRFHANPEVEHFVEIALGHACRPSTATTLFIQTDPTKPGLDPGWSELLRGQVRTACVPGEHLDMLVEPMASRIAALVKEEA